MLTRLVIIFKSLNLFSTNLINLSKGNGYERDFIGNSKVFIIDVFNKNIYPKDVYAESAISQAVKLDYFVQDYEYLTLIER